MTQEQKIFMECAKKDTPISQIDYSLGFKRGWIERINNVWHKPEEKPEENKCTVCITGIGLPLIGGPYHEHWEDTVSYIGITKWEYTDDLLPEEE